MSDEEYYEEEEGWAQFSSISFEKLNFSGKRSMKKKRRSMKRRKRKPSLMSRSLFYNLMKNIN